MVVIKKGTLNDFASRYPGSAKSLNNWYKEVSAADWSKISDVRSQFNTVDYVGNDRYVFNIKANMYRLVTMIFFDKRTLFIRFIGTHNQYDQINCSTI